MFSGSKRTVSLMCQRRLKEECQRNCLRSSVRQRSVFCPLSSSERNSFWAHKFGWTPDLFSKYTGYLMEKTGKRKNKWRPLQEWSSSWSRCSMSHSFRKFDADETSYTYQVNLAAMASNTTYHQCLQCSQWMIFKGSEHFIALNIKFSITKTD